MIATPSSSETGQVKRNYRPSPIPDQVVKKSGHPKLQAQTTTAAADKHHDSQNQKFIDKCIQRLADSNLWVWGTERGAEPIPAISRSGTVQSRVR